MPTDDTARQAFMLPSLWAWFISLFRYIFAPRDTPLVTMAEKKNVVVVGGGYGGTLVARDLSQKLDKSRFNLILVNDRPFYSHLPALARVAVSDLDKLGDKALFGYDKLFVGGNGTLKVGKVVAVTESEPGKGGEIELEGGEKIPYVALVLATGSKWPDFIELPSTEAETKAHLDSWRDSFKTANHVVIVGGGAVGIGAFLFGLGLQRPQRPPVRRACW